MKRVIVQIVQHLLPGGIETLALELQRCANSNDEVHIVSLEGSFAKNGAKWPVLEQRRGFLHFLNKQPGSSFDTLWRLYGLLRKLKPQVVHTHHIGPLLYGGVAARLAGIGVRIHTEHDAWHLQNEHRRHVEKWALRLVQPKLVADAFEVSASIRDRLGITNPIVIHNGIDVIRFSPGDMQSARTKLGLPQNAKIIGCAARLEKVKGHENLLDALFRLPIDVHLAIAGDGSQRARLEQQTNELGLTNRVHFLGRLDDDIPVFYRAINLFCLASLNEGMPISPLEAQACGTPVVITDVGGAREAVCRETGMIVEPNNARALAIALKRQLSFQIEKSPREFVIKGKSIADTVEAYNALARIAKA